VTDTIDIEVDASYVAIARHYFAKETRTTKAQQEGEQPICELDIVWGADSLWQS
jgi:hypothetical protein